MIPILLQNPESLQKALHILKKGGVIAHPADTCYGLAADFLNLKALETLQQIKGRDGKKPMSIMLPLDQQKNINDYAQWTPFSAQVCQALLPGPVTLLLPKGPKIPSWYFPETKFIGLRVPDDEQVQRLLQTFKGPLITTSANLSGKALCQTAAAVAKAFAGTVEALPLILETQKPLGHLPSTLLQIIESENTLPIVRQLRKGPLSEADLFEKLKGQPFEFQSL